MIKILTIIGARPQIIKAAAVSRAIRNKFKNKINEVVVHTGQHYDNNMSQVFFDEMNIPKPCYNLNVGSDTHGKQTAAMLAGTEKILLKEKPKCILTYGDTNSTLASAVAATKLHIPVVHIEAGLRSFNKKMPEEINRITCDHASTLLFSPTLTGIKNLINEGFNPNNKPPFTIDNPKFFHCGDVMYDNTLYFAGVAEKKISILKKNNLRQNQYILATIHRDNNTDIPERLCAIFGAMNKISKHENIDIIIPLHPRTSKLMKKNLSAEIYDSIKNNKHIKIIPPVSFLEMLILEKHSKLIMTDSGGVQKESFFLKKPCIILRSETEWKELVEAGTCIVTDANEKNILNAYKYFKSAKKLKYPDIFGDGKAAEFICKEIIKAFS
ncbi:MAG: UDP-N-acetylglucosamine 2-epimerase (non-hydrolyzing) [Bacteroidales bacterium]|nr:UDP-N-acetylglucosamine 2-epimerase (non-hydrolyzing) [Bacteroidales bacterium]